MSDNPPLFEEFLLDREEDRAGGSSAPSLLLLRKGLPLGLLTGDNGNEEEFSQVIMAAIQALRADEVYAAMDAWAPRSPINPLTGEQWNPGEVVELAEMDSITHLFSEALVGVRIQKDGSTTMMKRPYEDVNGKPNWLGPWHAEEREDEREMHSVMFEAAYVTLIEPTETLVDFSRFPENLLLIHDDPDVVRDAFGMISVTSNPFGARLWLARHFDSLDEEANKLVERHSEWTVALYSKLIAKDDLVNQYGEACVYGYGEP